MSERVIASYNAKDCSVTINGTRITGLGENMITIAKDENFFEEAVGAQGDVIVNTTNNDIYTLTLSVQATCPQKGELINLAKGGKMFPVNCANKSIGETFEGTKALIRNFPEFSHGATAEDREFEIAVFDGQIFGGQ